MVLNSPPPDHSLDSGLMGPWSPSAFLAAGHGREPWLSKVDGVGGWPSSRAEIGLVAYDSAHVTPVESELVVRSGHSVQEQSRVHRGNPAHPPRARGDRLLAHLIVAPLHAGLVGRLVASDIGSAAAAACWLEAATSRLCWFRRITPAVAPTAAPMAAPLPALLPDGAAHRAHGGAAPRPTHHGAVARSRGRGCGGGGVGTG